MTDLTHERCSELLGAYASGSLDASTGSHVRLHLERCDDCALELAAIEALGAGTMTALSGVERDELHRAVGAALAAPVRRPIGERFGRWAAPALGVAALVAVAVVAVVSLPAQPRLDAPATGQATGASEAEGGGDRDLGDDAAGGVPDQAADEPAPAGRGRADSRAGTARNGSAGGTAATAESSLQARAAFVMEPESFATRGIDLGLLVPRRTGRLAAGSDAATNELASSAPTRALASAIRRCAQLTVTASPHRLVPSSAAYYADDVLVIGFVWIEEASARLHYELRGWIGGRCDRITPIYRRGVLE